MAESWNDIIDETAIDFYYFNDGSAAVQIAKFNINKKILKEINSYFVFLGFTTDYDTNIFKPWFYVKNINKDDFIQTIDIIKKQYD